MPETTNPTDPFQLCGTTIEGKYRIASVVGDGGFGVVYRGVHKGFGELIAVKCLKLSSTLDEKQREALLGQLIDEGRILHRLSRATSGIVQALDVGAVTTAAGVWVPYLVLEWLEGETLGEFMRARREGGEGAMPLGEAIQLLEPAARALAVAHAQKVAHRDVKPANLFVTQVGGTRTLKVLDFGIAKVLTSNPSITAALEATKLGPTAFTPRYGAPEQFNKQRGASGPWTDVFALALILVELVSGKRALDGDDPTQLYIASADPTLRPTLRARGVEALESVEQVLEKALAVEPKHRYGDAGEFWDALVAAASAGGVPARARLSSRPSPPVSEKQGMLATAEFAAQRKLDVSTEAPSTRSEAAEAADTVGAPAAPGAVAASGAAVLEAASEPPAKPEPPSSGKRVGLEPTMPVESLRGKPAAPVRARSSNGSAAAAADVPSADKAAARDDDSMAETPKPARGNQPVVRRSGGAIDAGSVTPPRSELPGAPRAQRTPGASSRAPWGWVVFGVVVLGAAGGYTMWHPGDPAAQGAAHPGPSAAPSGRASAHARPQASALPTASASASAAASPSASGPPPVPPEDMVYIAPTTFTMGDGAAAREVVLSRGFFLERTEVTVRAYEACMAKGKCSAANHVVFVPPDPSGGDPSAQPISAEDFAEAWGKRCNEPRHAADHPINCVDYTSASMYCTWKGRRLPTEAEWELAARGTSARPFAWGTEAPECARACFGKNNNCRVPSEAVATCAVGAAKGDATPEGILGLGGNVSEWVSDGWAIALPGGTDPHGPAAGAMRVVRGGSFNDDESDRLRATARTGFAPSTAHVTIGFRCAQDLPGSAP